MGDKLRFEDKEYGGLYEPTDSDEEYSEEERELLQKVRERNQRKQDSKQEVLAFDTSDDDDEEEDENDDDDNESVDVAELMRDSDIEGAGEDDDADMPDRKAWGSKARNFYNTDFVDPDYSTFTDKDRELALLEEEEALAIQKRMASEIKEENFNFHDFGLDTIHGDNDAYNKPGVLNRRTTVDSSDSDDAIKVPAKKSKVSAKRNSKIGNMNTTDNGKNKISGLKERKSLAIDTSDDDDMVHIPEKEVLEKRENKIRSKDDKNKKSELKGGKSLAIDTSDDDDVVQIPEKNVGGKRDHKIGSEDDKNKKSELKGRKSLAIDTSDDDDMVQIPEKNVGAKRDNKIGSKDDKNKKSELKGRKSLAIDTSDDDVVQIPEKKVVTKPDNKIGCKDDKNKKSELKGRKSLAIDTSDDDDSVQIPEKNVAGKRDHKIGSEDDKNKKSELKGRKSLAIDTSDDDDMVQIPEKNVGAKRDNKIGCKDDKNKKSELKERKSLVIDTSDDDDEDDCNIPGEKVHATQDPKAETSDESSDTDNDDNINIPGMKVSTNPNKVEKRKESDGTEVSINLSGLSKREQLQLFQEDSPEFFGLVADLLMSLKECDSVLAPVLKYVKDNKLPLIPALKFAQLMYKLMTTYIYNINFYLMLKAKRICIRNHPIAKRLLELKDMLDRLRHRYENIIKPQLEALLERIEDGDEIKIIVPKEKSKQRLSKAGKAAEKSANVHDELQISSDDGNAKNDDEKEDEEIADEDDERRGITYQIAKNKGLTPHRKKELRNPRVKHRSKFRKALIRRKGAVRTVRKETKRYGGEISGIKTTVSKSIKFK